MIGENARFIDLSRPIFNHMPTFHRAFPTFIEIYRRHIPLRSPEDFSVSAGVIVMGDHNGTHIDATIHFDPNGKGVDQIPLELTCGPAIVHDFSYKKEHDIVTPEDVETKFKESGFSPGDVKIVLFRTGADGHYGTPRFANYFLEFLPETIDWLLDHGIKIMGVDALAIDSDPHKRAHIVVRRREYYHYENLTNLDKVLGRIFLFIGFPLKFQGLTGSPLRAVAVLED